MGLAGEVRGGGGYTVHYTIEEGLTQKTRQTVVVSVWGARSYAAMGIFVLNVQYCLHSHCTFPFPFVGGGGGGMLMCRFEFQV